MFRSSSVSLAACAAVVAISSTTAAPSRACSPPPFVDTRHFAPQAPASGTWWVQYWSEDEADLLAHLTGLDGAADIDVAIVSRGIGGLTALAVPDDAVVGARYTAENLETAGEWVEDNAVEVVAGEPEAVDGVVPRLDLRVEVREVRQGYAGIVTNPFAGMCEQAAGWWNHIYGEGAFAVVDSVPAGFVVDISVRPIGEPAFTAVTSDNQIVFDGNVEAAVDQLVLPPPGAETEFVVHGRLRRIADGAVGETVSLDIELDPTQTERTEFVGCTSVPAAPASVLALVLLALRRRRQVVRA